MATKSKAPAFNWTCQSRSQAQESIRELGDTARALARLETQINDQIAAITSAHKGEIDALQTRIQTLLSGIQTWCEANRAKLCGKGKSANLITGEIKWRQRPPSVSLRSVDKVIDTLKKLKLERFLREKIEVNKDAMLADPAAVTGIAGVTIVTGEEDFVVTPFEVEVS